MMPSDTPFTIFRSAAEEAAMRIAEQRWENEGGRMSSTAGYVTRLAGADLPYTAVLKRQLLASAVVARSAGKQPLVPATEATGAQRAQINTRLSSDHCEAGKGHHLPGGGEVRAVAGARPLGEQHSTNRWRIRESGGASC